MAPIPKTIHLAVLDDYLSTSTPHFEKVVKALEAQGLQVKLDVYRDTLSAVTQHDALVARLAQYEVISTMRERTAFPAPLLGSLPRLRLLLTTGMRNRSLDVAAAKERGITVAGTQVPSGPRDVYPGSESTVQHTWALILGIARGIARDDAVVKEGGWQSGLTTGLTGKTLGLLGLGKLGSATAKIAKVAFGMDVIAWSANLTQQSADESARASGLEAGAFRAVSKEELFEKADVLSVHYVLSDRSRGIVEAQDLARLKSSAFLVNTSRGPLVDETALLDALKRGAIAGAALDVYDTEPLPDNSPWRTYPWGKDGAGQVLLSPHMGYVERDVMHEWYEQTAQNVQRWAEGKEVVNRLI